MVTSLYEMRDIQNTLPHGQKVILFHEKYGCAEFREVDGKWKGFLLQDHLERELTENQFDDFLDRWEPIIVKAKLTIAKGWLIEKVKYVNEVEV